MTFLAMLLSKVTYNKYISYKKVKRYIMILIMIMIIYHDFIYFYGFSPVKKMNKGSLLETN